MHLEFKLAFATLEERYSIEDDCSVERCVDEETAVERCVV